MIEQEQVRSSIKTWDMQLRYPRSQNYLPPCRLTCPNNTDIRGWLGLIAQHKKLNYSFEEAMTQAWNRLVHFNPLPATTGRICPHPCEDQCNRALKDDSVSIHALERSIGDWALTKKLPLPILEHTKQSESIGVIGSGPASVSFAYQMARRGYSVTVYEQHPAPGGMLRYGIPRYRLPESIIDQEIQRIEALGVKFQYNTTIGKYITVFTLRKKHQALFIGIGAHRAIKLNIPGESGSNVMAGAELMYQINYETDVNIGKQVVIIGGGNTAIDAARTVRRLGKIATILYRRTEQEMPAHQEEIADAKAEGVRFKFLLEPIAIIRDEEKQVKAVQVRRMCHTNASDADGRLSVIPTAESPFLVKADTVVAAISQQPDWSPFEGVVAHNGHPNPTQLGQLAPEIWSGGDALHLGTVTHAIRDGRQAAEDMHTQLRRLIDNKSANIFDIKSINKSVNKLADESNIKSPNIKLDYYTAQNRQKEPKYSTSDCLASPQQEVRMGLSEEQFLQEISRCLSCGACYGCEQCWMYCNGQGYQPVDKPTPGNYFTLQLDNCVGCGKCVELCPTGHLSF